MAKAEMFLFGLIWRWHRIAAAFRSRRKNSANKSEFSEFENRSHNK